MNMNETIYELLYYHTEGMGAIGSNTNASYELECQKMLDAGIRWVFANPQLMRKFSTLDLYALDPIVYAFDKALVDVSPSCIRAQWGAVATRCQFIAGHGWLAYVEWCKANMKLKRFCA